MRYLYIDTNIFLNILLAEDPADSIHLAIAQENKTEFVTRDAELKRVYSRSWGFSPNYLEKFRR